jgi:hypothetical protein
VQKLLEALADGQPSLGMYLRQGAQHIALHLHAIMTHIRAEAGMYREPMKNKKSMSGSESPSSRLISWL